ncbi:protein lin-37 homolog [Anopheles maculipalpis]|uniref:protein lin-37 homolog n=1 Tax=Anopheles maculipalpis TaxID=1496333 RepID=UPI0021592B94|nr:protein lin-37 homolog [Anopheles maculipalpis]
MLAKRRSLINSDEKRKALQNVVLARGRLKGALKTVTKSSDDDSTSFDDSDEDSQMKRKRIEPPVVRQPYIITLFNRGIDLARFPDNSPLYPMCRAWVKNKPREKVEELTVPTTKPRIAIKREHNPDIVSQFTNGELQEITEMPRPKNTDLKPFLSMKPEPVGDFDIDTSSKDKDDLLADHLVRWKKVHESTVEHRRKYEQARFGTSFKLLEALKK